MKAPFYKVILAGKKGDRDISDIVESLKVDDTTDKDSMIEFNVKSDYSADMADDEDLVSGKSLKVQFGFAGGLQSEVHEGRISDVEVTYAERIKLVVRAFDKGVSMKRIPSQKVWANLSSSEIAKEVAEKYGLEADVEDTTHKWKMYAQGTKTDFEFLKELAAKEDGFIFFVTSNTLKFVKRDFGKNSVREFRYGDSELIEFAPRLRETQQSGATNKTQAIAVNPKTKKTVKSDSGNDKSYLGEFNINYTVNGDYKSKTAKNQAEKDKKVQNTNKSAKKDESLSGKVKTGIKDGVGALTDFVGKFMPMPGGDVDSLTKNLKDGSSQKKKNATVKVLEATIKCEGNPTIKLNEVITVSNVAKRYQGNWYVVGVENTIAASSAYFTNLKLSKNGTSKSTKDDNGKESKVAGKVNKSKGGSKSEGTKEVKVVKYDQNGNPK